MSSLTPRFAAAAPADDRRRRAPRRRLGGRGLVRRQRPAGRLVRRRASAILAAARELGWRPSASARALTEARTRAIGLVLARSAAQLEGDSFFVRFLSGIERALTAADYALLLQIVPGEASRRCRPTSGSRPRGAWTGSC